MSGEFIPDDIARFIVEKIESVAQLEALLLIRSDSEVSWSVAALSGRLYIDENQTFELLRHLCAQQLVVSRGEPTVYQYQPISRELRETVDRLAQAYSKQLVPVTNLIHSKPKTRVQKFADAFKFRKDD